MDAVGFQAYIVRASLPDAATADDYVAWLRDEHLAAVIRAGAQSARVVRMDADGGVVVEVTYEFASESALKEYLTRHAPGLRAEGLKRFGSERRITFDRRVGVVVATAGAGPAR